MNTKAIGNKGEALVLKYLKNKGYIITAQNFYSRFGEIDIIAENRENIVFVEVKTRASSAIAKPREAVDLKKQQKIKLTAMHYLAHNFCDDLQTRFDVAEILCNNGKYYINYIENAFDSHGI